MSKKSSNHQHQSKRTGQDERDSNKGLRESRFMDNAISPKMPFNETGECIAYFVREASKNTNLYNIGTLKARFPEIVERTACGLITEGELVGRREEADLMADQLRKLTKSNYKDAGECCARLYAMESFLYRKLNEVMRLVGQADQEHIWKSKLDTFGPFAFLLQNYILTVSTRPNLTIYRGANLSMDTVQSFEEAIDKGYRSFQAFTSGSRSRTKAEQFGNVLFIMNLEYAYSIDMAPFSSFPEEEEQLLYPGSTFVIKSVEYDGQTRKHLIYLTIK